MPPRSTVLVIDDKPYMTDLLTRILEDAGYRVRTASDGPSALESLDAQKPDLILLDVVLPGMSGLTLLRSLRQSRFAHIPVVLMSAHPLHESLSRAPGVTAVLTKPIDLDVLFSCVARHVRTPIHPLPRGEALLSDVWTGSHPARPPAPPHATPPLLPARSSRRLSQPPLSLAPLTDELGLGLGLPTLERVVARLDHATPQQPSRPAERWRYRFVWGDTALVIVGYARQALIYGNNPDAMARLNTIVSQSCLELLANVWPRTLDALGTLDALLARAGIDPHTPAHTCPPAALPAANQQTWRALYQQCAALGPEGCRLLFHTLVRQGRQALAVWLIAGLRAGPAQAGFAL